ncbi:cation diffusion facilitator family transporter [Streptomyces sp. NPDC053474]|uniref:cation diffusion facilitator family transporter n=1 Tax=Streptomyces sp. NPDC053474 TaxID=3365704 RepID=UPI0037CFD27B
MGGNSVGHAHTHQHGHGHDGGGHAGHSHGVSADADRRWLSLALVLIGVFIAVETVIAFLAGSLALISDAVHMLTDAFSIVLALVAMRLAARPAKGTYTFGLKRAEILSAQANGLTLLLAAAWLGFEAVQRLLHPPEVTGWMVLATALSGVAVNLAATWCLSKANRSSLNVEGAYQHILNDLYAFIGTAVAGVIVMTTGFARADTIATLFVVALMVKAGCGLLRDSGRILLEAAPAGLDPDAIGDELAGMPSVAEVHDLHIWTITSGEPALSAHVLVHPGGDCHAVRRELDKRLADTYGLTHTTLQIDHEDPNAAATPPASAAPHCLSGHGPTHRGAPRVH